MVETVIVTGAGSGIGAATCRRLAAQGIGLVIHTGAKRPSAEEVAAQCGAERCRVVVGDLADPATVDTLFQAAEGLGRLRGVVANAGFADRRSIAELDDAGLARSLGVMVVPLAQLLRGSSELLKANVRAGGLGRFVAVSSFLAHRALPGTSMFAASAAAKAGVEALVRSAAAELAPYHVGVNAVAPGYVRKDFPQASALSGAQLAQMCERIPMRRLGTPDDIAAAIEFLLGAPSAYITGQVIHVDGGLTL
ncbi:MAG: SDR family oxidoreductase [Rhizobacter sp.]|nr:SDR family oxidoreductase [Rhizobacter sp.]